MTRSKGEKAKYQSGKNEKTKIDQRERAHGVMLGGRERSITGNSSAPVFVVWGLDSVAKKKSISTTNLVQSGNRNERTLHIYSISRALHDQRHSHSNTSR